MRVDDPHATAGPQRIHALDGLRGVLALYVALHHLASPLMGDGAALRSWRPALDAAWYAVDLFFLMSGFVMAHVYGQRFTGWPRAAACRAFLRARIARLYPVHLLALALMALGLLPFIHARPEFTSTDGRFAWSAALASLFMLHGPWLEHRTWNYPAWSISAEWHAYLLFPLLAPLVQALRPALRVAAIGLAVAVPCAIYVLGLANETYPTNGLIMLARALPLFAAGIAVYGFRNVAWVGSNAAAGLACGLSLGLLATPAAPYAVLAAPLVVLAVVANPALRSTLGSAAPARLGALSYSLYMTHALVETFGVVTAIRWGRRWFGFDIVGSAWAASLTLALATLLALGVAWLTWRWVEVPARRWIMRWPARNTLWQRAGAA
jgi:peptidoglycan/LPS O-acetylase OafA/YrhL